MSLPNGCALVLIGSISGLSAAHADDVLFQNVRIFDGQSDSLSAASNVRVQGNVIAEISATDITVGADVRVIDGKGGTLMPGMIDAHSHMIMGAISMPELMTADQNYVQLRAGKAAGETLLRGFTTTRDLGGPSFGLKQAIDTGYVDGPRIYPSGATISQTSGHGDFRFPSELPRADGEVHFTERYGYTSIADGAPRSCGAPAKI